MIIQREGLSLRKLKKEKLELNVWEIA